MTLNQESAISRDSVLDHLLLSVLLYFADIQKLTRWDQECFFPISSWLQCNGRWEETGTKSEKAAPSGHCSPSLPTSSATDSAITILMICESANDREPGRGLASGMEMGRRSPFPLWTKLLTAGRAAVNTGSGDDKQGLAGAVRTPTEPCTDCPGECCSVTVDWGCLGLWKGHCEAGWLEVWIRRVSVHLSLCKRKAAGPGEQTVYHFLPVIQNLG